jgi:phage gp45-like
MWLTKLGIRSGGTKMSRGEVSGKGEELRVQGESEYHYPEMLFPYGYASAAEDGNRVVMLDGVCAGLAAVPDGQLAQGEVRLYSAGGAEILLKNNGEVVINGQNFPAKD